MARLTIETHDVWLPAGRVNLEGTLALPPNVLGLVVFAHGSGSGRFSPRNRMVAERLNEAGFGTLLLDLLTRSEEALDAATGHLRFDIDLLATRVRAAVEWSRSHAHLRALPVGLFGASTGAAAALIAAAERPEVKAVVSRGGRPDLAGDALPRVTAPTLLIVGGLDPQVLDLNRAAATQLTACEHEVAVVPGATHLFEEPGTLEAVARLARQWFESHLAG